MIEKYRNDMANSNQTLKAEGALISLDPATGYIVAMVGGRKFGKKNQFNRAVLARRQPGSTFKAFVYGAALQSRNFHPNTIMGYKIRGDKASALPLKNALKYSVNTAAKNTIKNIGPRRVINFAAPMLGIERSRLPEDPSLAYGTGEVTPLELCRGFAVYANDGKEVIPIAIRRITDRDGKVIKDFEKEYYVDNTPRQLISPRLARSMTGMLRGVVRGGTGANAARRAGFWRPAAGKTGSTQNYKDAWFVGFTPNLATAVWVGFDTGMSLGYHQFGGEVAAPIWARFMRDAHKDLPYKAFKTAYWRWGAKRAPWVKEPPEILKTIVKEINLLRRKRSDVIDLLFKDVTRSKAIADTSIIDNKTRNKRGNGRLQKNNLLNNGKGKFKVRKAIKRQTKRFVDSQLNLFSANSRRR